MSIGINTPCVSNTHLLLDGDHQPESPTNTISIKNAVKENTKHFACENSQLEQRWENLCNEDKRPFVICEVGFGTGLNFLRTAEIWNQFANNHNRSLHYIAIEESPLSKNSIECAHAIAKNHTLISKNLLSQYPPPLRGAHRLDFSTLKIHLTLIYDSPSEALKNHILLADAWFLSKPIDSRTPASLHQPPLKLIESLSFEGATLTIPSADNSIEKKLENTGFELLVIQGNKPNEEMLFGKLKQKSQTDFKSISCQLSRNFDRFSQSKPWLNNHKPATPPSGTVTVIGAGLAGAWTARTLADRGLNVTVLERSRTPGEGASGNPIGVLYVKPGIDHSNETKLALLSTAFASRKLTSLQKENKVSLWDNCGVLQLLQNDKDINYANRLLSKNNYTSEIIEYVTKTQAQNIAKTQINKSALLHKLCGKAHPKIVCAALLDHPNITTVFEKTIASIFRDQTQDRWVINSKDGDSYTDTTLVIATANDSISFSQTRHLPVKPIKGQISVSPLNDNNTQLKTVLCADGYAAYSHGIGLCFGASFELGKNNQETSIKERQCNLDRLSNLSDILSDEAKGYAITDRSSVRCSSPDYTPIVGPVAINEKLKEDFDALRKDAKFHFTQKGHYHPNLFVNIGHGSKGLSTTPLSAEIIADYIFGSPFPIENKVVESVHPSRFTIRSLIKNKEN